MTWQKTIGFYLLVAFGIMVPVCGITLVLRFMGVSIQASVFGFPAVAVGGVSAAIAGAVTAKKTGKIRSYKDLAKDFFCIKQPPLYYALPLAFLLITVGARLLPGGPQDGQSWLMIPLFFARAILFGGIEEIGWRYVFQPTLEKKFPFMLSSVLTFCGWAVWHMMYNAVDGTLFTMGFYDIIGFFLGLLNISIAAGCVYFVTKSLWLCVFYHAMTNALMLTLAGPGLLWDAAMFTATVALAAILVRRDKGDKGTVLLS